MLLIFRTCIFGGHQRMSNSLKDFLKEQLDMKNDTQLETHLEPIAQKYASDVCEKKGRHWSRARVVNSTEGLDHDFELKKNKLQNLITNEILNGKEFCFTHLLSYTAKGNILAHACR